MALGDSVGLLFKIRGDESDAVRALKKTENATDDLGGSTNKLSTTFSSMAAPAAAAAAGIAAIGAAAVVVATRLFDLAKQASDYGGAIFDAAEKTGLGTDSIQALKFAAEQSGASFEGITNAVAKFNVLVGNAALGNEKAAATLKLYGVTATDTDKALEQAISTIASMTRTSDQAAAAAALFKDRTGEILPVIKSFQGDLPGLIQELRDLGLIMSKENVEAADKLGDQLDTLGKQFTALKLIIGTELMPVFNDMAKGISDWLKENPGQIKAWGETFAYVLRRIAAGVLEAKTNWEGFVDVLHLPDRISESGFEAALKAYEERAAKRAAILQRVGNVVAGTDIRTQGNVNDQLNELTAGPPTAGFIPTAEDDEKVNVINVKRADNQAEMEKIQRARQLRDITAQINAESTNLKNVLDSMKGAYEELRKKLGEGASIVGFTEAANKATKHWAENLDNSLKFMEELEQKALRRDATEGERNLLIQQQQQRRHELTKAQDAEIEKNRKAAFEEEKKRWEERLEQGEKEADAAQAKFEADQERMERLAELMPTIMPQGETKQINPTIGIFDGWLNSWNIFFDTLNEDIPVLTQTFEQLGGIMQNAFLGMAHAIGSVIQQWVLYGNTGPAVMRKVLAVALASVAAEAAVKAIMATAEGFYFLATGNYVSAANAFTAAAFYGSVAAVAAIAGRAVAGNSFQQQTAQGGATGANRQGSTNREGGAYSSMDEEKREMGINRPANNTPLVIEFREKAGILGELFAIEIQRNGRLRNLIIDTANA